MSALHARIVSKGTVDKEEFLGRVHKFTGISKSLLAGAMEAFANTSLHIIEPILTLAIFRQIGFLCIG